MKITKIDNHYHNEMRPSIVGATGEWWFLNDKLHRGGGKPAVITKYSELYYYRGIHISVEIAQGKIDAEKILKIENIELRNIAMEILGYEQFLKICTEIDRFTPPGFEEKFPPEKKPMYRLMKIKNELDEKSNEVIKLLAMHDPNKYAGCLYIIRVHPDSENCRDAVAISYGFSSWSEYYDSANWETL